ncbi:MAG: hypothetical protein ABIR80_07775, partial [Opitutaceae bacterium]
MKASLLFLAVSVAANVALFAAYAMRQPKLDVPSATAARISASSDPAVKPAAGAMGATPPADATAAEQAAAKAWQQFHGGDLKALVASLRAAGFPLSTIRAVLYAELGERFKERRREIYGDVEESPFWKNQNNGIFSDPKKRAAMRAFSNEQTSLMKEALGADWLDQSEEGKMYLQRQYGDLAFEKVEQIQKLRSDYSELQQEIYSAANDTMLPEDREKLAYLEKEQRADLAKLLTPQELEEYEIRSSPTSMQLRSRLAGFKPTEAEFRAIYKLQKAMDDELGGAYASTPEQSMTRQEKQKELETQVQAILPPERAAQFKLATDPAYTQVSRVTARFNLPVQAAFDVVTVQKDIQQRATALR